LPSILAPYEVDLVVYPSRLPDIGEHMKVMGRVFRHFNDYEPDYDDDFVRKWLIDRNEDMSYYDNYGIVKITKDNARAALSRYDRPEDPFDDEVKRLYDVAEEWLWLEFGPYISGSRVYSSEEVESHLKDDKSPGAPWNLVGILSKGDYFDEKLEFYVKYWDALSTPNYIRSLCSSSGKEEIRPSEKIKAGKIRSVISMEVSHVKAHSQLCLDQNELLMSTIGKHSSRLGLVMQYGGWNELNDYMSCFDPIPSTMELDGDKFDARYRWYCFQKIRNFRYRCLHPMFQTSANWSRMCNLYHELCFAPFLDVDGHVYSRECGNPSGQACTTPDNIFKNFMDIVVLWHLIMPQSYHNYRDFKEHLRMCIVGDDINVSVKPVIQHIFNVKSIFAYMHRIDMVYTTPCENFRYNYECEFLGHGFQEIHGMYLPVINCQKMKTSMLRFNTTGDISMTIIRACGLRNETFACIHCRIWFNELIYALREKFGLSDDPAIVAAWKSYKTDAELWSQYTGYSYSDVCAALASVARSPEYKSATFQNLSFQEFHSLFDLFQNVEVQEVQDHPKGGQERGQSSQESL
jgi:hypothetical protein